MPRAERHNNDNYVQQQQKTQSRRSVPCIRTRNEHRRRHVRLASGCYVAIVELEVLCISRDVVYDVNFLTHCVNALVCVLRI